MCGWDDKDNDPASHIYDDYSYWRYVSDFNINTKAHHQQLLVALGSLASSVGQYMPHSINCVKCKKKSGQGLIEMLADSGASLNFTYDRSDLSEYQEISDQDFSVQTASKSPSLAIKGWDLCSLRSPGVLRKELKLLFGCTLSSTYQGSITDSYLWEPF